jgi:hypothetical protein
MGFPNHEPKVVTDGEHVSYLGILKGLLDIHSIEFDGTSEGNAQRGNHFHQ